MKSDLTIRAADAADHPAIRAVHLAAFPTPAEADLVDALRDAGAAVVSLVAVEDAEVAGHVLFSPVRIEVGGQSVGVRAAGLAPIGVLPAFQRRGIGAALIREGLAQCERAGIGAVVLLGDPAHYPRFGFRPAGAEWGLRCRWTAPPETFMAIELVPRALEAARNGVVHYHAAFDDLD